MNTKAPAKWPAAEMPAVRQDCESTNAPASGRDALAALYDAHADGVYGYLVALLGSDTEAEDALHDVFLRTMKRQQGLLGLRKPAAYLYRAARNEAYSRLRKRNVRARVKGVLARQPLIVEPDNRASDSDECDALNAALADLPVEQRAEAREQLAQLLNGGSTPRYEAYFLELFQKARPRRMARPSDDGPAFGTYSGMADLLSERS